MSIDYFFEDNRSSCPSLWEFNKCSYIYNAKLNFVGIFSIRDSEKCANQSKVICVENPNYKEEINYCKINKTECLCIDTKFNKDDNLIYYFYTNESMKCQSSFEMNFFHCNPIKSDCNKV